MARMAVVNDITGVVDNVITASPSFQIPGHTLVQSDVAGPGWTYAGGTFTPPPPVVEEPTPETALDGYLALIERRIRKLEERDDEVGALALRVDLLAKGR